MTTQFLKAKDAQAHLNVCSATLRRWADNKLINYIRTPKGTRLYDVSSITGTTARKQNVCYCRVSSAKQAEDLARQVAFMREKYPTYEIIQDIGSGLNFKRKGLTRLLERVYSGNVGNVVVSHRDRLTRFGFDLIKTTVAYFGGEIVVLNDVPDEHPQQELTRDLLAILHVYACRMHGQRRYKKTEKDPAQQESTNVLHAGTTCANHQVEV